jgi:hypothetical protein
MADNSRSFEDEVIDRLARIETRLDGLPDHEHRIRSLEASRWRHIGAVSVLSAFLSAAAEAIFVHFKGHV